MRQGILFFCFQNGLGPEHPAGARSAGSGYAEGQRYGLRWLFWCSLGAVCFSGWYERLYAIAVWTRR